MGKNNNVPSINSLSEELKDELYQVLNNLVEELITEAVEGIKSEIDEILRLIFHPNTDLSNLDTYTKNQISSLRKVFNLFKDNLKEEIITELRKELPKKITKVKLAKPKKTKKTTKKS